MDFCGLDHLSKKQKWIRSHFNSTNLKGNIFVVFEIVLRTKSLLNHIVQQSMMQGFTQWKVP